MSTDSELLELAARAAGRIGLPSHGSQLDLFGWNPLDEDGEALRLAAELRIAVSPIGSTCAAQRAGWPMVTEPFEEDRPKATRRAIVRAAAGLITTMTNTSGNAHCPYCAICHTSDESCFEARRRIAAIGARP